MLPPDEKRLSLTAASGHPLLAKDGRRPSLPSMYRWANDGVKVSRNGYFTRVKLQTERGPRGTVTSHGAVVRFVAALNGDDSASIAPTANTPIPPAGAARKQLAAAACDSLGI